MIEFTNFSGLIKCAQNPQLFFHMSEVIERKKLELNEKIEFSVVPVSLNLTSSLPFNNIRSVKAGVLEGRIEKRLLTFILI